MNLLKLHEEKNVMREERQRGEKKDERRGRETMYTGTYSHRFEGILTWFVINKKVRSFGSLA